VEEPQRQIIEEFTWSGPLSLPVLIVLGSALAVLVLVLSWRQCPPGRRVLLPLFILPRLAAVVIVLWMLAEPTARTSVRQVHRKAVSVIADVSASMNVVDEAVEGAEPARWAAAGEGVTALAGALKALDGAVFCLDAGCDVLAGLSAGEAGTPQQLRVLQDIERHLQACIERLDVAKDSAAVDASFHGTVESVRSSLDTFDLPTIRGMIEEARNHRSLDRDASVGQARQSLARSSEALVAAVEAFAAGQQQPPKAAVARAPAATRREKSIRLLELLDGAELGAAGRQADVLRYAFDREVYRVVENGWPELARGAADAGQVTDLAAALERVRQDAATRALGAVVMVTDGGHNAERDPLSGAAAAGPPLYLVPVGDLVPARDVALHHVQAPPSVMRNDRVVIEAMLDAYECAGEPIRVQLLEGDRLLEEKKLVATSDTFYTPLTFEHKAETAGLAKFRVFAAPVVRERTEENNSAELNVEVTEGEIRVLLADALPRWEFRYLRNLFKRDERIQFESILFEPAGTVGSEQGRGAADRAALPGHLETWSRFTVVILGDLSPDQLTPEHQQQLMEFVGRRGGTLVLIAGERAMPAAYLNGPLGTLLPVDPDQPLSPDPAGYRLMPTTDGRISNVTCLDEDPAINERVWGGQLPLNDLSPYAMAKPTSQVLVAAVPVAQQARTDHHPALLCWSRYGSGRVAYLSSPATYRLRYRYGDRYHYRFWGQFLRWAASRSLGGGSSTVRLLTDKRQYQRGDAAAVEVQLRHPNGTLVTGAQIHVRAMRQEAALRQDVLFATVPLAEETEAPGLYRATLRDLPEGRLRLSVGGEGLAALQAESGREDPSVEILVEPPVSAEMRQTRCNLPLLEKLARASGGAVVKPTALPTVLSLLDLEPEVTVDVQRRPLWPRWSLLWLFVGCLSFEWVVRKLCHLP
jgi:hypothetical protein